MFDVWGYVDLRVSKEERTRAKGEGTRKFPFQQRDWGRDFCAGWMRYRILQQPCREGFAYLVDHGPSFLDSGLHVAGRGTKVCKFNIGGGARHILAYLSVIWGGGGGPRY